MTKSPRRTAVDPSPHAQGNQQPAPRRKDRRWLTAAILIIIILLVMLIGARGLMNEVNAPAGYQPSSVTWAWQPAVDGM